MVVRHNALLNSFSTAGMVSPFDQSQEMPRDLLDSLTIISVESISGAPTTATITPRFHVWHSMVGGNQEELNTNGSGTSPDKSWYPISAAANPSMLPDGDWPAALDVLGATLAAPVGVFRTLRGGFPWKLSVAWAFTGGSSPSMRLSVQTYFRERHTGGFDRLDSGT